MKRVIQVIDIVKSKKIKYTDIPRRTKNSKINFEIENKKIENCSISVVMFLII